MTIGELAARTGKSLHTIRWYEKQGLIPGVVRDGGGRRTYVLDHVGWLQFIDQLRMTGMTVAEMRDYAALVAQGKKTLPDRVEILRDHRDTVRKRLKETRKALKLVEQKLGFYSTWLETGERPAEIPTLMRRPKKPNGSKKA
ncbi:MAG: MerR family transcriptional regulator [Alphaproteobacteria bacterium]|nr:MAG: MerR family transcriptional regulator [Alphaproteobacteria bacterium]